MNWGSRAVWTERCEDSFHTGHDGHFDSLEHRLEDLPTWKRTAELQSEKLNNWVPMAGETTSVNAKSSTYRTMSSSKSIASVFGLQHRKIAFLSHCGSRGIGHRLATGQFRALEEQFDRWSIPYPADDKATGVCTAWYQGSRSLPERYGDGCKFCNGSITCLSIRWFWKHFRKSYLAPRVSLCTLSATTSHNGKSSRVCRPGFTAKVRRERCPLDTTHFENTPFATTGHPILLPGNPQAGSAVMVGLPGAEASCYSVNHGAGRRLGRRRGDQGA